MLQHYSRIAGLILFAVGIGSFFVSGVPHFVQVDLFQGFLYAILGAIGLQLGFSESTAIARARYATTTGIIGLVLLLVGLTFPNFQDIFHLEIPEHIFHLILGVTGCATGDFGSRSNNP